MIGPLGISRRVEGNCTERTGTRSVGGLMVFKNLYIVAKFESYGVEIGHRSASDNGEGAHGGRNAASRRKLVQAADAVGDHVDDHELGVATE